MYTSKEILIFFYRDFFMDDVRDDVIIARPSDTNPRVFGVWHKYFDAVFVITAFILMLIAFVICVALPYRCTRFVWWFRQSFFTIRPMFPITRRNVVFVSASLELEIN